MRQKELEQCSQGRAKTKNATQTALQWSHKVTQQLECHCLLCLNQAWKLHLLPIENPAHSCRHRHKDVFHKVVRLTFHIKSGILHEHLTKTSLKACVSAGSPHDQMNDVENMLKHCAFAQGVQSEVIQFEQIVVPSCQVLLTFLRAQICTTSAHAVVKHELML